MPTRYLKPGIRDSERLETLSATPDAEVLYYRLLVTVDDFGRTDARPSMLKAACFPIRPRATADKCAQWMQALESAGLLFTYEVDGKPYLQITKWENKARSQMSKFPNPPTDACNPRALADIPRPMLPGTGTGTGTENREPELEPEPRTETKTKPTKKINGSAQAPFVLPEWIPEDHWRAWVESRQKARKSPTDYAKRLAVLKLDNLREQGFPPAQVLMQSAFNNWSGLFPVKEIK